MNPIRTGCAAAVLAGATSLAAPATADPPERVFVEVYDADTIVVDEFLSETCGYEVTASISGHYFETVYVDRNGDFRLFTAHPSFRSTLTSPYATVRTADVGIDKYTFNDDGTLNIFGTGIHLKIKGEVMAIGLWRLVYDPAVDALVSEEYHGYFDVTNEGIPDALCDALDG